MPRRDALPSNEHMLSDFSAISREVYISAYEQTVTDGLPPAFEGKPLSHLDLLVATNYPPDCTFMGNTRSEILFISPLQLQTAITLPNHLRMGNLPKKTLERYVTIATDIGETLLDNVDKIDAYIPENTVEAVYEIQTDENIGELNGDPVYIVKKRNVGTFSERPNKQILAGAKVMGERCLAYIKSERFKQSIKERQMRAELGALLLGEPQPLTSHEFRFRMVPDLPINGNESHEFLTGYRIYMSQSAELVQTKIAHLEQQAIADHKDEQTTVNARIDQLTAELDNYRSAAQRAADALS